MFHVIVNLVVSLDLSGDFFIDGMIENQVNVSITQCLCTISYLYSK